MRGRGTVVEYPTKTEKPPLKMKWVVVTEHGKPQLRMLWTVACATGAGAHTAAA